jgi:hypothetical protein
MANSLVRDLRDILRLEFKSHDISRVGVYMAEYLVSFLNIFQGLRKTIVMLAVLVLACIFRLKGYIAPDNWEGVLKATVVSFFASNACEHYSSMIKERLMANGKKVEVEEIGESDAK